MKVGNLEILVGADPELFVKYGREFVSAHGMVKGTKENPFPVKDGAVQVDGMALEFNIDPANNEKEFTHNLISVMGQLSKMVPDFKLCAVAVAEFSKEVMANTPDEAKILGCDADYNAWNKGRANPIPDASVSYRTAAGHIHIGWCEGMDITDEGHIQACILLAKQLDLYLGVPSLNFDKDSKRRDLYGKAGAFRVKSYGMEYRVLSNAWLKDKSLMSWVYNNTIEAVRNLLDGGHGSPYGLDRVINNSNYWQVKEYLEDYDICPPPEINNNSDDIAIFSKARHPFAKFFGDGLINGRMRDV